MWTPLDTNSCILECKLRRSCMVLMACTQVCMLLLADYHSFGMRWRGGTYFLAAAARIEDLPVEMNRRQIWPFCMCSLRCNSMIGARANMQALSPVGRCKTFDASGDGYGRGEGFAIAMLRCDTAGSCVVPV